MYLYGAGGHAKVILEILERGKIEIQGLFEDNPRIQELWGYPVTSYPGFFNPEKDELIIAIGNNSFRKKIVMNAMVKYGIAIHPFTSISQRSVIGNGSVVVGGTVINSNTYVGHHCIINTCASIDHDCVLSDYVHISPNATLCGRVSIGEGTHVGAGAVIIPGINIGKWCVVGAGAVVIKDVPDYATVVGNPGRIVKMNNI